MRTYQKIRVPTRDDTQAQQEEPKRERFLRMLAAQVGKLGSGNATPPALKLTSPTNPPIDLSKFFFLPGRPGGQVAHFATGPGQSGYLISTADPTKGFILFGLVGGSAYDETENRFGIGTATPQAKLHIEVGASASQFARPSGTVTLGGWADQDGATTNAAMTAAIGEVVTDDATYIAHGRNLGTFVTPLSSVTDPTINTGHKLRIRSKVSVNDGNPNDHLAVILACNGTTILSLNMPGTYNFGTLTWEPEARWTNSGAELGTSFVTYECTLTEAEAGAIRTSGTYAQLTLAFNYYTGFDAATAVLVSWVEFEVPPVGGLAGDVLQRWQLGAEYNDLAFANDEDFQLSGPFGLLLLPDAGVAALRLRPDSADALIVEDVGGTALAGLTEDGNYYLLSGAGAAKIYGDVDGDGIGAWATAASLGILTTYSVVTVTTTHSILTTDTYVLANATGGGFTVTLPTAVGVSGKMYEIKKIDSSSNIVTVATTSSQTIDGDTTMTIGDQNVAMAVVSDGSNWRII